MNMVKARQVRVPQGLASYLKSSKTEGISYKQILDTVFKTIAFDLGAMMTTVPRGGLQLAQPLRLPEFFQKAYLREFSEEDRASWQAILKNHPVTGSAAWGSAF